MATLTKTLTISSAAGDMFTDALGLSMSYACPIAGAGVMKLITMAADTNTVIATADGRSIVYLKNSSGKENLISIFTDPDDDGDNDATALIFELKDGEFAIFPSALDHALVARAAASAARLEVGIFTEA